MNGAGVRGGDAARFYGWNIGVVLFSALVLVAVFEFTDLDRSISDLFFDATAHKFFWRHHWFLEVVMHLWAKYLIIMLAVGAIAGFLASFLIARLQPYRRALLFVFLALVLAPMTVSLLKMVLAKHCPYDLEIYGGFAPYQHLLETPIAGIIPGKCFPGGHASGGFALMAFYFMWHRSHSKRAFAALALGAGYGMLLGAGRLLQGAHFMSHNLWSAVVVWSVLLLLYRLVLHREHFSAHSDR